MQRSSSRVRFPSKDASKVGEVSLSHRRRPRDRRYVICTVYPDFTARYTLSGTLASFAPYPGLNLTQNLDNNKNHHGDKFVCSPALWRPSRSYLAHDAILNVPALKHLCYSFNVTPVPLRTLGLAQKCKTGKAQFCGKQEEYSIGRHTSQTYV